MSNNPTVYKREGSPYYSAYLKDPRAPGGLIRKSTKATSAVHAGRVADKMQDALYEEIEAELDRAENTCGMTWLDAVALYCEHSGHKPSTIASAANQGLVIQGILGDFDMGSLTEADVARFVHERRQTSVCPPKSKDTGRKVKDPTIRKNLSTISAVYDFVIQLKLKTSPKANPVKSFNRKGLKTSKIVDNHLRPNQFQEALSACKMLKHKAELITLVGCGLRSGELIDLHWPEVDLAEDVIEFGNVDPDRTKTSRSRRIPIVEPVHAILVEWMAEQKKVDLFDPNGRVFPAAGGGRQRDLKYLIKIVRARTSVKGYLNHGLRHTFASWYLQQGLDPKGIGKLLGHSTTSTTDRYAHHTDDSLLARVRGMRLPIGERVTAQITAQSDLTDDGPENDSANSPMKSDA